MGKDYAECSECGQAYTQADPCVGIEDFQVRESTTISASASTKATPDVDIGKAPNKKKIDGIENWVDMDGEVLPSAKTLATKAQVLATSSAFQKKHTYAW